MTTTPSNGPRPLHASGKTERAAIVARLEQIANELTFPGLSPRQAEALELEKFALLGRIENDAMRGRQLQPAAPPPPNS
jgi:hypothetical protein